MNANSACLYLILQSPRIARCRATSARKFTTFSQLCQNRSDLFGHPRSPFHLPQYEEYDKPLSSVLHRDHLESGRSVGMSTAEALAHGGIIPDVVQQFEPKVGARIQWNAKVFVNLEGGNKLTLEQTKYAPEDVTIRGEQGHFYTLELVDPDAPSRSQPSNKEWIHWLVVNIPNGGLNYGGDTAIEYFRPTPPAGSGLHRYAFIIWDQGTRTIPKTEFPHIKAHDAHGRSHWKSNEFGKRHDLTAVGATWFTAETPMGA